MLRAGLCNSSVHCEKHRTMSNLKTVITSGLHDQVHSFNPSDICSVFDCQNIAYFILSSSHTKLLICSQHIVLAFLELWLETEVPWTCLYAQCLFPRWLSVLGGCRTFSWQGLDCRSRSLMVGLWRFYLDLYFLPCFLSHDPLCCEQSPPHTPNATNWASLTVFSTMKTEAPGT